MVLLLDIGNSRIKWGIPEAGRLHSFGVKPHGIGNLHALVNDEWRGILKPDRVVVSNVLGKEFANELDEVVRATWQINAEYVTPAYSAFGVINAYHEPGRLGVDRWAALIAARHAFKGNLCVIDSGTALTIDLLAADGQHLGGVIIPGFSMMRAALLEGAAGIGKDADAIPQKSGVILPCDTLEAVYAGSLYASIAAIDRVVDDVSHALGAGISGIITGGDAPFLQPLLKGQYMHEPNLVLKGLAIIAGHAG